MLKELSELSGTTGSNNEQLISVSWLQHLDKEKGECLIFHGRKYPYLATLPDIDVYDGANFEVQSMTLRSAIPFSEAYGKEKFFQNILKPPVPVTSEQMDALTEIQSDLTAKFDSLFGSSDESSASDN